MILDGVRYPVIHFCRVTLSRMIMVESSRSQSFLVLSDEYLVLVPPSPVVYRRLCLPFNATLTIISPLIYFSKTLSPSLWQVCSNPIPSPVPVSVPIRSFTFLGTGSPLSTTPLRRHRALRTELLIASKCHLSACRDDVACGINGPALE